MKTRYWLGGCLSIIVLFAVFVIAGYHFINKTSIELVEDYTSSAPLDFQRNAIDQEEVQETIDRFRHFMTAVKNGEPVERFTLSAADINNLLQNANWFRRLRGMAHVAIHKDLLLAEISVPLGMFNDRFQGRYLNGKAELAIGIVDEQLRVTIARLEVDGRALPGEFMTEIRNNNVLASLYEEPILETFFNLVATVKIEDGGLVFQSK